MKNRLGKVFCILLAASMMAGGFAGCGAQESKTSEETENHMNAKLYEGYTLKWEDNFDGKELNRKDWNVELHEPGWVNEELQEYVDSEENIYLKDGMLYLNPVQTPDGKGGYTYTSGRVSTQNKQDFTYGMFECRAKVPYGKGYLPAFWLMATDENIYGQWPRCGEIDIMEVLGDQPKTLHGTIHYGNPHSQSQGDYSLTTIESFASDFHTFNCEWEPGKITWYVDGVKYHEESDWYSTTEGQGTLTYPAPFDQPFYIILNLAVGGSWVGYPDETTSFDNNPFIVDYVRVYQKDSYDENVTRPVEEFVMRDPNEDGNYVNNGDFSVEENLNDSDDWKFLLADGGKGAAEIADNMLTITTEEDGNVDYSVQLVQPNIPMQKGSTYKISFDAWASEDRTTHLAVKAPDRGWIEYFGTETVKLTTEKTSYEYEFQMQNASDANGRLEFNMGAADSVATIYLTNVRVDLVSQASAEELNKKEVLADGNHLYNGKFREGDAHMGFWEITNNSNAQIGVTDFADGRRLKVETDKNSKLGDVKVGQSGLAIKPGKDYVLTFSAESAKKQDIVVNICGKEYPLSLKKGKEEYTIKISKDEQLSSNEFAFILGNPGTLYLADVLLK